MSEGCVLDSLPLERARLALARCCGSKRWISELLARRPFGSPEALERAARELWRGLDAGDQREAFSHHPPIGADLAALGARFARTAELSRAEQSGTRSAEPATLAALAAGNRAYLERFGFVFLICATGKSAAEMLAALNARLAHSLEEELRVAAGEQEKIMVLRLEQLHAARSAAGAKGEIW